MSRSVPRSRSVSAGLITGVLVLALGGRVGFAQMACQPAWQPTFGAAEGVGSGGLGDLAVFDDGNGPALYAGGAFERAGAATANFIAKWDGTSWAPLGSGMSSGVGSGQVRALAVFDDGGGAALYAGGRFDVAGGAAASNVAKWNGASWSALGTGLNEVVYALAVFDDGSGPALYAGGNFTLAGGTSRGIAKWNGSSWIPLGAGVSWYVDALAVHDDGSGAALFVGGDFTTAGGVPASDIAKWNGTSWSAVGGGITGSVAALRVFDDGGGPKLYAGGQFTSAGGAPANYIARWNGAAWSALGSGTNFTVSALTSFNDGSGPALYAGGRFSQAGGIPAARIAKWNGTSWSPLGSGMGGLQGSAQIGSLAAFDEGSGPRLFAGGSFTSAGGAPVNHIARWNGSSWSPMGGTGLGGLVSALVPHDVGSGPGLVAGGWFLSVAGATVNHIARWNGSAWSALGTGTNAPVHALAVYDDGGGPALYAGGMFTSAGGGFASHIAKWNGTSWSQVGGGLGGGKLVDVLALAVFDDGSGPALYAGGEFFDAGGVTALGIARWNGTSWSALDGNSHYVVALTVHDDGSGPALVAAGAIRVAGGTAAIAKWNGTAWSPLGSGMSAGTGAAYVYSMSVFDDGSGAALYAGGSFTSAGGVPANYIARWSGSSWSALGSGVGGGSYTAVTALGAFDDGVATALCVSGNFTMAGGSPAQRIARWDGAGWSAMGGGLSNGAASALAAFDAGGGPELYAGGSFAGAVDSGDSFLARWGNVEGCGVPGVSVCHPGVGGVSGCPCSNPPSVPDRGCNNGSGSGGALLSATGIARLTYDTLVFTAIALNPSSVSLVFQGDALSASGVVFGHGVRCATGSLKRLYLKHAVAGSIQAPEQSDLGVHERSAAQGDVIMPGSTRVYGVFYRDPLVLGGCSPTITFNVTQQLSVVWAP